MNFGGRHDQYDAQSQFDRRNRPAVAGSPGAYDKRRFTRGVGTFHVLVCVHSPSRPPRWLARFPASRSCVNLLNALSKPSGRGLPRSRATRRPELPFRRRCATDCEQGRKPMPPQQGLPVADSRGPIVALRDLREPCRCAPIGAPSVRASSGALSVNHRLS